MNSLIHRSPSSPLLFCDFLLPRYSQRFVTARVRQATTESYHQPSLHCGIRAIRASKACPHENNGVPPLRPHRQSRSKSTSAPRSTIQHSSSQEVAILLADAQSSCKAILSHQDSPTEEAVSQALQSCQRVANNLLPPQARGKSCGSQENRSAASTLLQVDESGVQGLGHNVKEATQRQGRAQPEAILELVSKYAYHIVQHRSVFITPRILHEYVQLQNILGKPETLPEVLRLFATKPVPVGNTSPLQYAQPSTDKAANGVAFHTADLALQTAINTRQLATAIDIVGQTYATVASQKAKFVRKGLLPLVGLAATPLAAYAIASRFGLYQTSMDPQMATNMAFVGILCYVGFSTTLGVIAVTTANDQMQRVTWATGVSLRERWLREEERAAIDKIACSWGFGQIWRRGEEEGPEWDMIREWIGRKGMRLDRSELMEGME